MRVGDCTGAICQANRSAGVTFLIISLDIFRLHGVNSAGINKILRKGGALDVQHVCYQATETHRWVDSLS
jgi:hypothetical protein